MKTSTVVALGALGLAGLYLVKSGAFNVGGPVQTSGTAYPPSTSGSAGSSGDGLFGQIFGMFDSMFKSAGSYFNAQSGANSQGTSRI